MIDLLKLLAYVFTVSSMLTTVGAVGAVMWGHWQRRAKHALLAREIEVRALESALRYEAAHSRESAAERAEEQRPGPLFGVK